MPASLLIALTACADMPKSRAAFAHPGGLHTRAQIAQARDAQDAAVRAARDQLLAEAEGCLARSPAAVAEFRVPGYYGDAKAHMAAKAGLSDDASAAYALALASHLAPPEKRAACATKALQFLNAWAATNRKVTGADGDLVMCYAGVPLLFAADLLADDPAWPAEQREAFRAWVRVVFLKSADGIKRAANNHGAWGLFAALTARHLLDDAAGFAEDAALLRQRIGRAIAPSGELPAENLRTNSGLRYTAFALTPMTAAAAIVRHTTGEDLFRYVAPNGASLRLALDKHFAYCLAPESWPYRPKAGPAGWVSGVLHPAADRLLLPSPISWPGNLFEAMASVYGESAWADWVKGHRPIRGDRGWIYPTLLPPEPSVP